MSSFSYFPPPTALYDLPLSSSVVFSWTRTPLLSVLPPKLFAPGLPYFFSIVGVPINGPPTLSENIVSFFNLLHFSVSVQIAREFCRDWFPVCSVPGSCSMPSLRLVVYCCLILPLHIVALSFEFVRSCSRDFQHYVEKFTNPPCLPPFLFSFSPRFFDS